MKARELMTDSPACVTPDDTARHAAEVMADNDCGCIPVVDESDGHVVGVVTDRDLALRATARGKGPKTTVRQLMTHDPLCCSPDADVREVERVMANRQVRRVVIADADRCCVGIISQADLARAAERGRDVSEHEMARVVERISEPSARPDRSGPERALEQMF